MKTNHYKKVVLTLIAVFSMLISCEKENDTEFINTSISTTEIDTSELEIGIDFSADMEYAKTTESYKIEETNVVQLNKVRVWLWSNENAEGDIFFKIRHVDSKKLIATSSKLAASKLKKPIGFPNTDTGKIIFDLSKGNIKINVGEKYRIEIYATKIQDGSDSSKRIIWGAGMGVDSYPGNFGKYSSTDGSTTFVGEAVFETENIQGNTRYIDQSHKGINLYMTINESPTITNDMKVFFYQEFIPSNDKEIVEFEDSDLEKAIKIEMNLNADEVITKKMAKELKTLVISKGERYFYNITNLSGIEHFSNLESLDFSYNTVTDMMPLENLKKLIFLRLSSNNISNLTPIENLTSIKKLYLNHNQINNIISLKKLTQLEYLNLIENPINPAAILGLENYLGIDIQF